MDICAEMKEFYLPLHVESRENNTQKAEIHQLQLLDAVMAYISV